MSQDAMEFWYRTLYWELNELLIIGNKACIERANRVEGIMQRITDQLGYVPEA